MSAALRSSQVLSSAAKRPTSRLAIQAIATRSSSTSQLLARPAPAFTAASQLARASLPASKPFSTSPAVRKEATRFTAEHEWVKFDDESNIGTMGITDYAQKSLGDVVFVELPSEGSEVKQGEQIGSVESVKAASDIYSPVSGIIKEVNSNLSNEPGLLNKSPEEKGWLCKIQLAKPAEFEVLLDGEAYKKLSEDA